MIQRIQSLWLLVAAALAVAVNFINVGTINLGNEIYYQFNSFTLDQVWEGSAQSVMHTTYIAVLWFVSAILSIVTIFLFKNRQTQIRLNGINMLVMLAALVVMLYIYPNLVFEKADWFENGMVVNFNYWTLMSLIPAVALFLANRAIKKDEKRVRAADRLR